MVHKLIEWALNSPLIVGLLMVALVLFGTYAFLYVNVEAYPDPAPAIIEVVAQYPGASAEEVERQVTIPLEVALAGMPGLTYTRTKSLFGLSHLRNQFEYGVDYYKARQEVINRLASAQLPTGVTPQISPFTPTGELIRYTLSNPRDLWGLPLPVYSLVDLKALQDWTLEREFRRVPRIADVSSFGGMVKRYEVHPDPDRLKKYGLTLTVLQNAISNSNRNGGGDLLTQGRTSANVREVGLIGGGLDPMQDILSLESKELEAYLAASNLPDPEKLRIRGSFRGEALHPVLSREEERRLREIRCVVGLRAARKAVPPVRAEEEARLREIRDVVISSINNVKISVADVVEGGPGESLGLPFGTEGAIVGHQTRLGKCGVSRPRKDVHGNLVLDAAGNLIWDDEDDKVQGIVLMRKNEDTLPALQNVKARIKELTLTSGRMLPGVSIDPHFDLSYLIDVTTETVRENLALGMILVSFVLLMFLSNVRSALIVAINIPLALLFAFTVLFVRGKSANLLSIGAIDFGIIVDSSVIMVENIYRHISTGEHLELPLKERILRACNEVERALFFSTAIMVCAFIPLFTMQGPEGQIFGPMADTYAFALGGALILALVVSPPLCMLLFRNLKPAEDNLLVRWLKRRYLLQLERCLNHRLLTLGFFGLLIVGTFVWVLGAPMLKSLYPEELQALPTLGREFMPELEEGNLYIRGTFPVNVSLEEVSQKTQIARGIMRRYPEVQLVASQIGRPDDGTDPTGFSNVEFSLPLNPEGDWPKLRPQTGWRRWFGWTSRPRTKPELIQEMNDDLRRLLIGVDWEFSQYIRDNVMESLSGVKGDNSVKIFGPDLEQLEKLADVVKNKLNIDGIKDVSVFRILGQSNLEFGVDRQKCKYWGVSVADVQNVIQSAVGGTAFTQMIEGEKTFDITLRWPARLRDDEAAILNIPVDITNNQVTGPVASLPQTPLTSAAGGISPIGSSAPMPSLLGNPLAGTVNNISSSPRQRLRDLVAPVDAKGRPDPTGRFNRPGASTIYREQGKRFIAVGFSVRGRDLAGAVAEAQEATAPLIEPPYQTEWSGEFQEMQEAERRLMFIIPISMLLVFIMLYLAFHSLIDVLVILSNVVALSLGGIWALLLTGTNFSISAAVGFISIFGVAIMDGLLLISYFNQMRAHGLPLREAIMQGAERRVRPIMMTALTAVFGLLPAALSTRIGVQTQKPLAIVVVGGMITTLLMTRYLMPVLYSFYGHREPSPFVRNMAH